MQGREYAITIAEGPVGWILDPSWISHPLHIPPSRPMAPITLLPYLRRLLCVLPCLARR